MIHQKIKDLFEPSVEHVCSDISDYSIHLNIDFQRNRKISPQKLISFLVSQGSFSTKVEMLDFWGLAEDYRYEMNIIESCISYLEVLCNIKYNRMCVLIKEMRKLYGK